MDIQVRHTARGVLRKLRYPTKSLYQKYVITLHSSFSPESVQKLETCSIHRHNSHATINVIDLQIQVKTSVMTN